MKQRISNVHIYPSTFTNETRILKETSSLIRSGIVDDILMVGIWEPGLAEYEKLDEGRSILRIKEKFVFKKSLFHFIGKYIFFHFQVISALRGKKIEIINCHNLSVLAIGVYYKIFKKTSLVFDAHELETERNGLQGFRKFLGKLIEKLFIQKCDLVIVVGDCIADWYAKTYKIQRPIVVKNSPEFININKSNIFREKFFIKENCKIFLYQGGLFKGRGIETILEAFKTRTDNKNIAVFMGYGELESMIKTAAKTHDNIYYHPAVSPDILLEYTSSADYGIFLAENVCLSYYYSLPNKFFEYSMAGLPVIVSNMYEMARIVKNNNFGLVIEENDPKHLNHAVEQIQEYNYIDMSKNAHDYASANSWEYQEKILIKGYKNLVLKM